MTTTATITKKRCPRCGETKPAGQFARSSKNRSGLYSYCRPCNSAAMRAWTKAHPERAKIAHDASRMRRQFGLEAADYRRILDGQGGACAICRSHDREVPGRRLSIDHNHNTGTLRGLLCARCNRLLGSAEDSAELLEAAAAYLRAHS